MRNQVILVGTLLLAVGALVSSGWGDSALVPYPKGYRGWTHVKSMIIQPGHALYDTFGGIHHIYADKTGMKALQSGKAFPDGAILIFDLLEVKSADNTLTEGQRKVLGVMQKDSKRFAGTGGWGCEGFKGDTQERVVSDAKTACFDCHATQNKSDYVFSRYRK